MRFPLLLSTILLFSAVAPAQAPTASSMLSPALNQLRQSLGSLRVDKWKAPGAVREDANNNIGSITRDVDNTLPGLLTTADNAPSLVSANLPVFRNVDALYDVLLRVVETADLAAPDSEANSLHLALSTLENARRSLGDALETSATAEEGEVAGLRQRLQAQAVVARPEAAPTVVTDGARPAAAATHKRKAAPPRPPAQPANQPQ